MEEGIGGRRIRIGNWPYIFSFSKHSCWIGRITFRKVEIFIFADINKICYCNMSSSSSKRSYFLISYNKKLNTSVLSSKIKCFLLSSFFFFPPPSFLLFFLLLPSPPFLKIFYLHYFLLDSFHFYLVLPLP